MSSKTDHSAEKDALRRIDQIKWTAHRVVPTDVGEWRSVAGQPVSAAEMVTIAPADLLWLTHLAAQATTAGKDTE